MNKICSNCNVTFNECPIKIKNLYLQFCCKECLEDYAQCNGIYIVHEDVICDCCSKKLHNSEGWIEHYIYNDDIYYFCNENCFKNFLLKEAGISE